MISGSSSMLQLKCLRPESGSWGLQFHRLEYFGDKVFTTVIPKNVKVEEATDSASAIYDFAPGSTGAKSYAAMVQEFVLRSEATDG